MYTKLSVFGFLLLLVFFLPQPTVAYLGRNNASISGVVYHDVNGNTLRDSLRSEKGFPHWQVFIDTNGNQLADPNELTTTTLDGPLNLGLLDGVYYFHRIPSGATTLCVVPPPEWASTQTDKSNCRTITLGSKEVKLNFNFGYWQLPINLVVDVIATPSNSTEAFPFEIKKNGQVIKTFELKDLDPPFTLSLPEGIYEVNQSIPSSSDYVAVDGGCLINEQPAPSGPLNLKAGDQVFCSVYNQKGGQIHVLNFHDLNLNYMQDLDEPGLENWPFTAYISTDCTGPVLKTGVTDSTGKLILRAFLAGTYSVANSGVLDGSHPGWFETSNNNCRSATFDSLEFPNEIKQFNFGNASSL